MASFIDSQLPADGNQSLMLLAAATQINGVLNVFFPLYRGHAGY